METLITLMMFLCAFCFFNEQDFKKPDYDLIKKNIADKKSEYYQPNRLKSLKANE